jgi:dihydrofolate reductase
MLSLIVAMTEERVIGRNGQLPWHLSEDLKRFKRVTMGHPIVMGRKTFESIGKPLPGRKNIVVSQTAGFRPDGVEVVSSLKNALDRVGPSNDLFVIGGARMFEEALPLAGRIYLTLIHRNFPGDVFFPPVNWNNNWVIDDQSDHQTEEPNSFRYSFQTLSKKRT